MRKMLLSNDFLDKEDEYTGEVKCRFCGKWRDKGTECICINNREAVYDRKISKHIEKKYEKEE